MSPEKPPIMARFSSRLEKNGLSLGDAVNVALFVLTLVSLYFAWQGVRLAKIAIADAHTQSAKASQEQDVQFREQMQQLKASSNSLDEARSLLGSQSEILRKLQHISQHQLKDLNAQETRIRKQESARPIPDMWGGCNGTLFLNVPESGKALIDSETLKRQSPGSLNCFIRLANHGNDELKNVTLQIAIAPFCLDPFRSAQTPIIDRLNGFEIGAPVALLISGQSLPPISKSNRTLGSEFTISTTRCSKFRLSVFFEADNLNVTAKGATITLQP